MLVKILESFRFFGLSVTHLQLFCSICKLYLGESLFSLYVINDFRMQNNKLHKLLMKICNLHGEKLLSIRMLFNYNKYAFVYKLLLFHRYLICYELNEHSVNYLYIDTLFIVHSYIT